MADSRLKISVVVITWQHAAFIGQTLQGIFEQKVSADVELIISNDASPDNSDAIIRNFLQMKKDEPAFSVHYFLQDQNLGMMQNLIFALEQCSCNYIAICEGDDYWTDSAKLQKQLDAALHFPQHSMIITNRSVLQADGKMEKEDFGKSFGKKIFTLTDVLTGFIPGTQTMFFRNTPGLTNFLAAHPEIYYGDRYITYFVSLFGSTLLLEDDTAVYRITGNGEWTNNDPLQKLHKYVRFMTDFHRSLGIPEKNIFLGRLWMDAAYTTLRYCLKRPGAFKNSANKEVIGYPWKNFRGMNRMKLFFYAITHRK